MSCPDKLNEPICVIRGDQFQKSVGLSDSYSEVIENPSEWQGRMVFKEDHSDGLPAILTLTASVEPNPDYDPDCYMPPNTPAVYMHFTATSTQTGGLPAWNHVLYCELLGTGPSIDPPTQRLFNADVNVSD